MFGAITEFIQGNWLTMLAWLIGLAVAGVLMFLPGTKGSLRIRGQEDVDTEEMPYDDPSEGGRW